MVYGDPRSCQELRREGVRAYTCGRPIKTGYRCDECQAEHEGAPAVIALLRQRIFDLERRVEELESRLPNVKMEEPDRDDAHGPLWLHRNGSGVRLWPEGQIAVLGRVQDAKSARWLAAALLAAADEAER